jgi:hypothetical protein
LGLELLQHALLLQHAVLLEKTVGVDHSRQAVGSGAVGGVVGALHQGQQGFLVETTALEGLLREGLLSCRHALLGLLEHTLLRGSGQEEFFGAHAQGFTGTHLSLVQGSESVGIVLREKVGTSKGRESVRIRGTSSRQKAGVVAKAARHLEG